jgi:hypothetical protein
MEVPDLGPSSILSLDHHVPVVDKIKVSVRFQFRYNVEISFNIESEFFVQLSLGWFLWVFISIDNLPSLVNFSVSLMNNDVSVFSINTTSNIEHLLVLDIHYEFSILLEQLPPS